LGASAQADPRLVDQLGDAQPPASRQAVAASLSPPGESSLDELGVDPSELAKFGLNALNRRLAIIGVPLDPDAR
jgi:hypothetical protein